MRIAYAGTPEFAVPALRALAASGHELVGVLTQPDRPRGRGRRITPSPVKLAAQSLGLPVSQPRSLAAPEDRAQLCAWRPDLLVVVAYGLILPPSVLELPPQGCLNVHASLLPRWRGAAPIQRAILAGDVETGVTLMQMDAGLDTGPMLLQRRMPIPPTATAGVLEGELAALGADALLEALQEIATGRACPRAQPSDGVTYARKIEKSEAAIDWRATALSIERQVRAFNPWPIAETRLAGEPLRIFAARAEPLSRASIPAPHPGTVLSADRDAIRVCCGEGQLAVTQLQRPGGKVLAAGAFVNAGGADPERSLVPGRSLGSQPAG